MLHFVVATHNPESCPASHRDMLERAHEGLNALEVACIERGMRLVGGWVNRPAHALYLVVDAPHAHAVNQLALDLRLAEWNTVDVAPVIEVGELRDSFARMLAET